MKDYSRLKEHCYQTLKLPTSPRTTAEHLMILELIEYYEEHESILDKIRAEIESMDFDFGDYYDNTIEIRDMVCKVIDKYKAESEDKKCR